MVRLPTASDPPSDHFRPASDPPSDRLPTAFRPLPTNQPYAGLLLGARAGPLVGVWPERRSPTPSPAGDHEL